MNLTPGSKQHQLGLALARPGAHHCTPVWSQLEALGAGHTEARHPQASMVRCPGWMGLPRQRWKGLPASHFRSLATSPRAVHGMSPQPPCQPSDSTSSSGKTRNCAGTAGLGGGSGIRRAGEDKNPPARVSERFMSVKGGLIPFPHRGNNPFSAIMTRGSRGSELPPRRGASGWQLEQTPKQEPCTPGSRGQLSSTGRSSGRGWAHGPAQQPSP